MQHKISLFFFSNSLQHFYVSLGRSLCADVFLYFFELLSCIFFLNFFIHFCEWRKWKKRREEKFCPRRCSFTFNYLKVLEFLDIKKRKREKKNKNWLESTNKKFNKRNNKRSEVIINSSKFFFLWMESKEKLW